MARTETTESGGRLPQPTEEVHLPDPSYLPVLVALGTTLILVGIVVATFVVVIGAVILLSSLARWISSARREIAELPLDH
jgi:hypothetical protein